MTDHRGRLLLVTWRPLASGWTFILYRPPPGLRPLDDLVICGRNGQSEVRRGGRYGQWASRVEGRNKEFGATILMTEATYHAAGLEMLVSDRGLVNIKGRQDPVRLYEVPVRFPIRFGEPPDQRQAVSSSRTS